MVVSSGLEVDSKNTLRIVSRRVVNRGGLERPCLRLECRPHCSQDTRSSSSSPRSSMFAAETESRLHPSRGIWDTFVSFVVAVDVDQSQSELRQHVLEQREGHDSGSSAASTWSKTSDTPIVASPHLLHFNSPPHIVQHGGTSSEVSPTVGSFATSVVVPAVAPAVLPSSVRWTHVGSVSSWYRHALQRYTNDWVDLSSRA